MRIYLKKHEGVIRVCFPMSMVNTTFGHCKGNGSIASVIDNIKITGVKDKKTLETYVISIIAKYWTPCCFVLSRHTHVAAISTSGLTSLVTKVKSLIVLNK